MRQQKLGTFLKVSIFSCNWSLKKKSFWDLLTFNSKIISTHCAGQRRQTAGDLCSSFLGFSWGRHALEFYLASRFIGPLTPFGRIMWCHQKFQKRKLKNNGRKGRNSGQKNEGSNDFSKKINISLNCRWSFRFFLPWND